MDPSFSPSLSWLLAPWSLRRTPLLLVCPGASSAPAETDDWSHWHAVSLVLNPRRTSAAVLTADAAAVQSADQEEVGAKGGGAAQEGRRCRRVQGSRALSGSILLVCERHGFGLHSLGVVLQKKGQIFSSKAASKIVSNCLMELIKNGPKRCVANLRKLGSERMRCVHERLCCVAAVWRRRRWTTTSSSGACACPGSRPSRRSTRTS